MVSGMVCVPEIRLDGNPDHDESEPDSESVSVYVRMYVCARACARGDILVRVCDTRVTHVFVWMFAPRLTLVVVRTSKCEAETRGATHVDGTSIGCGGRYEFAEGSRETTLNTQGKVCSK